MDEKEKKVDDTWKNSVEKEKQDDSGQPAPEMPVADFSFFITTLSMQAAMALGVMPNPVTNQTEVNLGQAKLIIDTMAMLKEKTAGNLSTEEDSLLETLLYELRLQYVEKTAGEKK